MNGSSDWESMGIMSSNPYDIDDQIFFSYPLSIINDEIKIIDTVDLSERSTTYIKNTEKELISERDIIKEQNDIKLHKMALRDPYIKKRMHNKAKTKKR